MESQARVLVDIDGPIAYVTLNRPDKLNAVDLLLMSELVDAARVIKTNRNIRVVILRGNGESFCAGLDFGSVMSKPSNIVRNFVPLPWRGTNNFQHVNWVWRTLPVPVIAVTQGHVFGAGLQLALAADFRYSTLDCQWSVLEAKWGLVPDMSGTVPLSELVGADVAKRLAMTGEIITGTRAAELGLVTHVSDDPLADALALAELLMTRSPDSVSATKKLLNETRRGSVRRAFAIERRLQFAMLRGKNAKIARTANIEKMKPEFEPRSFG